MDGGSLPHECIEAVVCLTPRTSGMRASACIVRVQFYRNRPVRTSTTATRSRQSYFSCSRWRTLMPLRPHTQRVAPRRPKHISSDQPRQLLGVWPAFPRAVMSPLFPPLLGLQVSVGMERGALSRRRPAAPAGCPCPRRCTSCRRFARSSAAWRRPCGRGRSPPPPPAAARLGTLPAPILDDDGPCPRPVLPPDTSAPTAGR